MFEYTKQGKEVELHRKMNYYNNTHYQNILNEIMNMSDNERKELRNNSIDLFFVNRSRLDENDGVFNYIAFCTTSMFVIRFLIVKPLIKIKNSGNISRNKRILLGVSTKYGGVAIHAPVYSIIMSYASVKVARIILKHYRLDQIKNDIDNYS